MIIPNLCCHFSEIWMRRAYAFRKKHLHSKTKIVPKDLTLVLLVRKAGIEEKFKEFDE